MAKNKPGKVRIFLLIAILTFGFVLALYWNITQQGVAAALINWQLEQFGGYYVIITFGLTLISVLVPCLPIAFIIGKLCDRLGL